METATTRQLITLLIAISLGLVFAAASLGCADKNSLPYRGNAFDHYSKDSTRHGP